MVRYYVVRRSLFGSMVRWFVGFATLAVCATAVQWALEKMAPAMLGVFAVSMLGLVVFRVIGRGRE